MSVFIWNNSSKFRLSFLYPEIREMAQELGQRTLDELGFTIKVADGFRTYKEQDFLFSQGRENPGKIITYAKGGKSYHNFGVAFDIAFSGDDPYLVKAFDSDGIWEAVGLVGEWAGLEWGGHWTDKKKDKPHFQKTYGMPEIEMDEIVKSSGVKGLWTKFDSSRGVLAEWADGLPDPEIKGE